MRAKKHLGQNFLTDKKFIVDIIGAGNLKNDDFVLEIGPGKGVLTEELIKAVPNGKVLAIEKDKDLVPILREKFNQNPNFELVGGDVLKFDPLKYGLKQGNYKIIANIPYYLTSHLFQLFLESDPPAGGQPSLMVFMVQKEVADRIMARNKGKTNKESILSISVKVYGVPKIIKRVPSSAFSPKPKVDSAIILISDISKQFFKDMDEKLFFKTVKTGFSQKRKKLKNNLNWLNDDILNSCHLKSDVRAENLSPEQWGCIVKSQFYPQK